MENRSTIPSLFLVIFSKDFVLHNALWFFTVVLDYTKYGIWTKIYVIPLGEDSERSAPRNWKYCCKNDVFSEGCISRNNLSKNR